MTRKEETKKASELFARDIENAGDRLLLEVGFQHGAEWADTHPKNPWRDPKTDPPKDGEWCLFEFSSPSWAHGSYEARQMPNMAMFDYIRCGDIIGWMPIPEAKK